MPNYEYRCDNPETLCNGVVVEVTKAMTDQTPVKCSVCGAEMKKLMSRSEFRMHSIKEGKMPEGRR